MYIQIKCACVCVCTQLCLTLCNSIDCSLPGISVHEVFLARILEWVAISYLGDLPDPAVKPTSLRLLPWQADSFLRVPPCYCLLTKSCLVLCNSKEGSMQGLPVLHCLLGFAQMHVHWIVMPSSHLTLCRPLLLLPPGKTLFTPHGYFIDISWRRQSTDVQACLLHPSFDIGLQHLSDNVLKSHDFIYSDLSESACSFVKTVLFHMWKMRIELTLWNKYNSVWLLEIKQIYMLT